jgi:hypothetical protein
MEMKKRRAQMIKELAWYLENNRFSNISKELKTSIEMYRDAKEQGSAKNEQTRIREHARALFEDHCVRSGLREKELSYINIEAEFFDGNTLDEKALDTFIKNIVKGHCYQKHLWLYLGTTGNCTEISKRNMAEHGQNYEKLLPAAYQKSHPPKNPLESMLEPNCVPIYVYSDGSVSCEYNREKAQYRHNILADRCGLHWNHGYDPNDSVQKSGWKGSYDSSGTWVKVLEKKDSSKPEADQHTQELTIITDGDRTILYDPGMTLLNAESLLYLTENGDEYGYLESDVTQTVEDIRNKLSSLGIKKIDSIGVQNTTDKTKNEKTLDRYHTVLNDLADSNMNLIDAQSVNNIINDKHDTQKKLAEEIIGLEIERIIRAVSTLRKSGQAFAISRALSDGIVTVPLSPLNQKDGEALGLSKEEISEIAKQKISPTNKKLYETILSNVYAGWTAFAGSALSRSQLAKKVQAYLESGKQLSAQETITAEVSLGTLLEDATEKEANGIHLYIPNIPGDYGKHESINCYDEKSREKFLRELENANVLPKGGTIIANEVIQTLLPSNVTESQKEKINRSVMRGLKEYQAISMSTGMKIREVIEAAISSASSGTLSASGTSALKKNISYELQLEEVIEAASQENHQSREEHIDSLLRRMKHDENKTVVIGGSTGKPLSELGFNAEKLEKHYHYKKESASEIADFLSNIRIKDNVDHMITSTLDEILVKTENPETMKKSIVAHLAAKDETGFNLKSDAGFSLYTMSERYKASGLDSKILRELVEEQKLKNVPAKNLLTLAPKYRDTEKTISLNRNAPRGMPESITMNSLAVPKNVPVKKHTAHAQRNIRGLHERKIPVNIKNLPSDKDLKEGITSEIMRLRQIEAEYEKEKAEWEKKQPPVLTKNTTQDLGYTEENSHGTLSKRDEQKMMKEFINRISAYLNPS